MFDLKGFLRGKGDFKDFAKIGVLYMALASILMGVVMFSYIFASPALVLMTAEGWVYLAIASLGHAATFALAAYAVYMTVGLTGLRRPAVWVMVGFCALCVMALVINRQVYAVYRFHINGFILNMITGPGAGNIFVFDLWMVVKECMVLALFATMAIGLYYLSSWVFRKTGRGYVWPIGVVMVFCILSGHLYHAYGAFTRHVAVTRAAVSLPYFYPLTAKSLLTKLGVKEPDGDKLADMAAATSVS